MLVYEGMFYALGAAGIRRFVVSGGKRSAESPWLP